MQLTYSFLNLIHPHMLRVGNLNLQALQDSTVSWDSLVETMSQQATTAPAPGAGGLTQAQLPTIAPEVSARTREGRAGQGNGPPWLALPRTHVRLPPPSRNVSSRNQCRLPAPSSLPLPSPPRRCSGSSWPRACA